MTRVTFPACASHTTAVSWTRLLDPATRTAAVQDFCDRPFVRSIPGSSGDLPERRARQRSTDCGLRTADCGLRSADQHQARDQKADAGQAPDDGADEFKGIAQLRVIDGQRHNYHSKQQAAGRCRSFRPASGVAAGGAASVPARRRRRSRILP